MTRDQLRSFISDGVPIIDRGQLDLDARTWLNAEVRAKRVRKVRLYRRDSVPHDVYQLASAAELLDASGLSLDVPVAGWAI